MTTDSKLWSWAKDKLQGVSSAVSQDVEYFGIFLSPESKFRLLQTVPAKFSTVYADHITVLHRHNYEDKTEFSNVLKGLPKSFNLKDPVKLQILREVYDDFGQAVEVDLPFGYQSLDLSRTFHITISTSLGIPQKYSNQLLEQNPAGLVLSPFPFTLQGKAACWPMGSHSF